MNQSQRNFLIERIEKLSKTKLRTLRESMPERPSLSIYLLHAVMSNDFDIISNDKIKEVIKEKALNSKEREDWLGNAWHSSGKNHISFNISKFFIVPEEYQKRLDKFLKEEKRINNEMFNHSTVIDSLIVRIKLASNSTLETMIKEVDDMGNISLMDTKLKSLTQ